MKRKKKNKNNQETSKILMIIAAVAIIIVIIGGATFAYWSWQSDNEQKTIVDVTVAGGSLTIDGGTVSNVENNNMYPTAYCDGSGALIGEISTVTANNETATPMTVTLSIDTKLTKGSGSFPSSSARQNLMWSIVDVSDDVAEPDTCDTTTIYGNFDTSTTSGTVYPVDTGISFEVPAKTELIKKYRIYVWLDETYEFVNSGDNVTDPMQGLGILVKWSEASTMTQQPQS